MRKLNYLGQYPVDLQNQARDWLESGKLAALLGRKYPDLNSLQTNKALYDYAQLLKSQYLRQSAPLSKVQYSDKVSALNALGTHQRISRVQGAKLKAKKEIHIDSRFKKLPEPFLRMILVHELAHLRELEHNKAFYRLCEHMLPDYHQLEFDLRLYLTWLEYRE